MQWLTKSLCTAGAQKFTQPQRIDIFVPNSAKVLFHGTTATDVVQPWDSYSELGSCQYGVSAVSLNPRHVAVFSSHGLSIYFHSWDGTKWQSHGAIPLLGTTTKPTVVQTSRNSFELFYAASTSYTIWHRTGTRAGGWSVAASVLLGDQKCNANSPPVAVSRGNNLVDLFFASADNGLYWKSWAEMRWKPAYPSYMKLGENCAHPEAVARHRNRIDLFALNLEGELLYKSWNGRDWEPPDLGFHNLGGSFASRPAVVSRSQERLDLFIIGKDTRLYHKALDNWIWKPTAGFLDLGGNFQQTIPPTVIWSRVGMEVFLVGGAETLKGLYHKRWDGDGDPMPSEFESLLKWDCAQQPAVVALDVLDSTK